MIFDLQGPLTPHKTMWKSDCNIEAKIIYNKIDIKKMLIFVMTGQSMKFNVVNVMFKTQIMK